jgi:hypothetical protein
MAASAAMIAEVRRLVNEPTTTTYSDVLITTFIETYPMIDSDGIAPDETDWTAVYNLNRAAADIWEEKAAAVAEKFDYAAEGSSFKLSQISMQYLEMAKALRARRVTAARLLPETDEDDE